MRQGAEAVCTARFALLRSEIIETMHRTVSDIRRDMPAHTNTSLRGRAFDLVTILNLDLELARSLELASDFLLVYDLGLL